MSLCEETVHGWPMYAAIRQRSWHESTERGGRRSKDVSTAIRPDATNRGVRKSVTLVVTTRWACAAIVVASTPSPVSLSTGDEIVGGADPCLRERGAEGRDGGVVEATRVDARVIREDVATHPVVREADRKRVP